MDLNSSKPAPRVPLKMGVEYRRNYARQADQGALKNISLTGAFLECVAMDLQPQDKLSLVFNVSGRVRTISAQVVWNSPNGAGVRFLPENNRDVQIVDDLMYFIQNRRDSKKSVLDDIFKKVG